MNLIHRPVAVLTGSYAGRVGAQYQRRRESNAANDAMSANVYADAIAIVQLPPSHGVSAP